MAYELCISGWSPDVSSYERHGLGRGERGSLRFERVEALPSRIEHVAAGKVRLDAGVIDDIAVLHAQHGGILDPADVDLARPRHDRRRVVHLEGAAVVAPAGPDHAGIAAVALQRRDRKSTRLNSSH